MGSCSLSFTRWWPILLVALEVVMGNPTGVVKDPSQTQGSDTRILKEKSIGGAGAAGGVEMAAGGGLRHVRAASENGAGLSMDDGTLGYSNGYFEDSLDPVAAAGAGSSWGSEEDLNNPTTGVIVPFTLLKNLASAEILRHLRPVTSKAFVENSAKWFLPPSVNNGGSGSYGFPRHSRADSNFIRFGRSHNSGLGGFIGGTNKKNNFIRLGRENPKQNNFIRLGRSASGLESSSFRYGGAGGSGQQGLTAGFFSASPIPASSSFTGGPPPGLESSATSTSSLYSNDYDQSTQALDNSHRMG